MAVFAVGCAPRMEPLTMEQLEGQARQDRTNLFLGQEPVLQPITRQEAVARAIKYNLDHRLKMVEEAVARGQIDLAVSEMLPDMEANRVHGKRSNIKAVGNKALEDQSISGPTSFSESRTYNTADLTMVWNLLDFGITYAQAKQSNDQYLIVQERRRKAIHDIIRQTNLAWWKAAAAAMLEKDLETLLARARQVRESSRNLARSGAEDPSKSLDYQRGLLDIERQLLFLRRQFEMARLELASLIHYEPQGPLPLAIPDMSRLDPPEVNLPVSQLEMAALQSRPELREVAYQGRIDREEIRKSFLRLLPNVEGILSLNWDSSKFLMNNNWTDTSVRLSYGLVNLFRAPATMQTAQVKEQLAEIRRLALSMAVISQVHLSHANLRMTKDELDVARQMEQVNREIYRNSLASRAASAEGDFAVVKKAADALMANMQRISLYGETQNHYEMLKASMGLDPLPSGTPVERMDVGSLAQVVAQHEVTGNNLAHPPGVTTAGAMQIVPSPPEFSSLARLMVQGQPMAPAPYHQATPAVTAKVTGGYASDPNAVQIYTSAPEIITVAEAPVPVQPQAEPQAPPPGRAADWWFGHNGIYSRGSGAYQDPRGW